ncbi:MAG: hypothetical protein IID39_05700 [Planctomycetes bacterium]|nr:hypothetical protein [Planctomycetota bacterium]
MSESSERIERLINRRLDGELSGDEARELEAVLSRSPEYREMLAASQRIDVLCSEAIAEAVAAGSQGTVFEGLTSRRAPARRGIPAAWWVVPSALAASLAMFLFLQPLWLNDSAKVGERRLAQPTPFVGGGASVVPVVAGRRVSTHPLAGRRHDKQYYGVVGNDGNLYLIEVGRVRTYRQPQDRGALRPVGFGM